MTNRNRGIRGICKKGISLFLCLTLALGGVLTAAPTAFAGTGGSANVTVRIVGSDQEYLPYQELSVETFDLAPFVTGDISGFNEPLDVSLAHALIEAVYFAQYGQDPSASELAVAADSATASAIKGVCHLYDDAQWGLSLQQVFAANLGAYYVNNTMISENLARGIVSGENIVFFDYTKTYTYFDVMSVIPKNDGWPYLEVKLRLMQDVWGTKSAVAGAAITEGGREIYEPYTDDTGIKAVQLYAINETGSNEFELSASATGIIAPYCKISFTCSNGGADPADIRISQDIMKDVSLKAFTVDAGNGLQDVLSYAESGRILNLSSGISAVTVAAVTNDAAAAIQNASPAALVAGSASFPLQEGANQVAFEVKNGQDVAAYALTIRRESAGAFQLSAAVDRVMTGILDAQSYPATWYDADWILAAKKAGKTITQTQKDNFLTGVLARQGQAGPGAAAKMSAALSALSIDATKVPGAGGAPVDLVAKSYAPAVSPTLYDIPYALMLQDMNIYQIPSSAAWPRERLIQWILDNQSQWTDGLDETGMMLQALRPYYKSSSTGVNGISATSCTAIKAAADQAIANLKTKQQNDGNFGSNSNSDAMVILGLTALGIDANSAAFTKDSSVVKAMITTFESSDHRLGYQNQTYNEFASKQGLQALAVYKDFADGAASGSSLYGFSATVAPYPNWPNADLLTGIQLTDPAKTQYTTADTQLNLSGLKLYAIYNNNAAAKVEVPASQYTVTEPDGLFQTVGQKTVAVSYQGYRATFVVTVTQEGGGSPTEAPKVSVTVKNDKNKVIASSNGVLIEPGVTSALDVLQTVLSSVGKTAIVDSGGYVVEIDGLGEFGQGENSGWLYSVNGAPAGTIAAADCKLHSGDRILWYYTLDYTEDPGSKSWSGAKEEIPLEDKAVTPGGVTTKVSFVDVKEGSWYSESVLRLAALGILNGKPDGRFDPGGTLIRAELSAIFFRMSKDAQGGGAAFSDVPQDSWYGPFVGWMASSGITTGIGEQRFAPNAPVSRQDLAVLLSRYAAYMGIKLGEKNAAEPFADEGEIAPYAKEAVVLMQKAGILHGIKAENGELVFEPQRSATRAEIAVLMDLFLTNYRK